jgi:hypothetical protein
MSVVEKFFIPTPTATNRLEPDPLGNGYYPIYQDPSGLDMRWSGKMPLPKIGDRVNITMNSIGYGEVKGYFVSVTDRGVYLGVMVLPENPPDWHKRQVARAIAEDARARRIGPEQAKLERIRECPQWLREGIATVFGSEIRVEAEKEMRVQ